MARNVMKHPIHKWGGNILSIRNDFGSPIRRLNQQIIFVFKNNILKIAYNGAGWSKFPTFIIVLGFPYINSS